ncbi:MAG: hypothetical protein E4G99_01995 [Anaerolineales bacterium]|nr:MAG: hypothetical protein E4G99_01995 [Anaerolineales bacterium]
MLSKKLAWLWPGLVSILIAGMYIGVRLSLYDFDPVALAEIGPKYATFDPEGEPGYDGQFSYYMARDLAPSQVEPYLDVPAYRYQRILYPLLARILAFGQEGLLGWTLLGLNWVVHGLATLGVCWVLEQRGTRPGYALIYGLWVGLIAAVGLDLHEPLAYGLVVGAWVLKEKRHEAVFALCLVLALFVKATTLLFWAAALLPALQHRNQRKSLVILLAGGFLFLVWQVWLWSIFGSPGLGSGGDMATGFEWIPWMGMLRIGFVDWKVFGLFLLIFGPTIVLPSLWGIIVSVKSKKQIIEDWATGALLLHALLIVFLPFSTFREPLGIVRIATGLVLSILMVSQERGYQRTLNYSLFWIPMIAMLIPQA